MSYTATGQESESSAVGPNPASRQRWGRADRIVSQGSYGSVRRLLFTHISGQVAVSLKRSLCGETARSGCRRHKPNQPLLLHLWRRLVKTALLCALQTRRVDAIGRLLASCLGMVNVLVCDTSSKINKNPTLKCNLRETPVDDVIVCATRSLLAASS